MAKKCWHPQQKQQWQWVFACAFGMSVGGFYGLSEPTPAMAFAVGMVEAFSLPLAFLLINAIARASTKEEDPVFLLMFAVGSILGGALASFWVFTHGAQVIE